MRLLSRLYLVAPIIGCLLNLSIVVQAGQQRSTAPDKPELYECGVLSLYTFLRLNNVAVKLQDLDDVINPSQTDGHTLKELRDAGKKFGLRLIGVHLRKGQTISAPVIIYFKSGRHGHYAVLRPVGHTGKLVQLMDTLAPVPEVSDFSVVTSRTDWTGICLMRKDVDVVSMLTFLVGCLTVGISVFGIVLKLSRGFRNRSGAAKIRPGCLG